jgi:predicted RNA binding protein YcfA (HicA-like mRNA interferase family)
LGWFPERTSGSHSQTVFVLGNIDCVSHADA